MSAFPLTGGCQCGAVRFEATGLGRASVCHCRMCQKAFGAPYGALVTAHGLKWTKAEPARFRSSNKAQRGFCGKCGTPMTFEVDGAAAIDVAIVAFDNPGVIEPVVQMALDSRIRWADRVTGLPEIESSEKPVFDAHYAQIVSNQHPDHPE